MIAMETPIKKKIQKEQKEQKEKKNVEVVNVEMQQIRKSERLKNGKPPTWKKIFEKVALDKDNKLGPRKD